MKRLLARPAVWAAVLLVLATLAIVVYGGAFATRTYLDQSASRGQTTLRLAIAVLRGQMSRYQSLPALIADHYDVQALLSDPDNPALRTKTDAYLKEINGLLASSDIYVIKPGGETIAASNFDGPVSFVGENFSYRPYYQDAIQGRQGRFFALGTTSLKRGYYFSAPVIIEGAIKGVVVFKVDIDTIEASWKSDDYEILVSDPEGIIFMTDQPDWLYAGLLPLTADRLARTEASRRYANATLRELPITARSFNGRHRLMTIVNGDGPREYLVLAEAMPEAGWTVSVLLDTAPVHAQVITSVTAALLFLGLAALAGTILLQRRAQLRERLEIQRSAQAELEQRVALRTADLALVNTQLESEVAERRATEQQLRQTQADLIQAGKLAALGQMSAALSHEFNQPLTAVKTYADNAAILIERNRIKEVLDNVSRISSLADRMASISRHLRNFARKPNEQLEPVALAEAVKDTLEIARWRLKAADTEVTVDLADERLMVQAGQIRLQQVLVNLISNAADAVEGQAERRITLKARRCPDGKVEITVADNGPGIPDAIAPRIFDPFFSTKGVGKGLGLGLSISYNIIKDFGGNLTAMNQAGGGAMFTITLDAAMASQHEAAE
jgi:two-component system, NtrC family, C4-dicarboxylate transport sensor histidine kinase DctB